ncbi:MAG: uridine kinase [Myxococcota bacterium]
MAAKSRDSDVVIVGIAGGTGSGKTTIAKKLAAAIPRQRCLLIEHDSYYRDQSHLSPAERAAINYDHPDSLDSDLLADHLVQLRAGRVVELPIYDFVSHTRKTETRRVSTAPVIIVEGILVFVEARLRDQFDIKLFVDTDPDIRLIRRIWRDLEQRGRTFHSVREQYYGSVRPMHLKYVEPSKRWADLIIPEGGENQIALDILLGKLGRIAFAES